MIPRLRVDTNNIIRGGQIWAYTGRASRSGFTAAQDLSIGDTVIAHDVAEQGDFKAVVRDIVEDRVFMELDWDTFAPWEVIEGEEGDYYENEEDNDDE